MSSNLPTVVIVEDHLALCRGLELVLRRAGIRVIGSAGDGPAGAEMVLRRVPDVALVDYHLPVENGVVLTEKVRDAGCATRVLIFTAGVGDTEAALALDAGAAGIALKSAGPEELVGAIRAVAAGRIYLDPALGVGAPAAHAALTPRERQVLELLARGLTGPQIADHLVLSPETVRTHVQNGVDRLQAKTRVNAVAIALSRGEISL